MPFVYFLKLSNNNIYKGTTGDVKKRVSEHKNGKVKSTKNYWPLVLIGYEYYHLKTDAKRREKFLKTSEGRKLLKRQYRDIINSKIKK
ncbi:GIY-YIG nuclease family protein [Patescibacteria group bacterium]|nr:GIY-YIG nuclease family protein [Patescibacteria group bacterium]MBU0964315.1 GIY-YIG nuclease family protein [Patescibacteria group bacterium]